MPNVRSLRVWCLGMEIVEGVEQLVARLPRTGAGELRSQMTRAAISIVSNVAEGAGRGSDRDFKRFVGIALGSCRELETQLEIVKVLGVGEAEQIAEILEKVDHEGRMLRRLSQTLELA